MNRPIDGRLGVPGHRWPIAVLCLLTVGCGGDDAWHAETQPVQGEISVNGMPPLGAFVTLHPTGEAFDIRESKPWGVVGADGTYVLRTYEKGDGAPVGEYVATVEWREDPSVPGSPDLLAGAYTDPAKSDWKVTIEEGQTALPRIEITGAKVAGPQKRRSGRPSPFDVPADAG